MSELPKKEITRVAIDKAIQERDWMLSAIRSASSHNANLAYYANAVKELNRHIEALTKAIF